MARNTLLFIAVAVIALSFAPKAYAFGAGNIPSYSYMEDKAFRHGDIEDVIAKMIKVTGGGFLSRGVKFSGLDVKRTYFGNWLRDYSQAVDIASLKMVPLQTVLNIVMVLGFLAHGYATGEFEVTKERLGTYLPTEHIDNPKGYGEGEDPRKYDPRMRPPVDPRELEIDPQSGMKNYIANERGHWDTSSALVRRTLGQCIDAGRNFVQTKNSAAEYEAFRLLGQALHTLEDFTAHSNYCELVLISLGYQNVFPHVGRNTQIRSPQGRPVFPLVTGSFGGADFIHSLMGEAGDKLSSAAVSDLSKSFESSRSINEAQSNSANTLRSLFLDLPDGQGQGLSREMDDIQTMRANGPPQDPSTMSPQELHATLWKILSFRDSVMKKIENTLDKIPLLGALVEKISNSVSVFIMTTLEPYVKPLLGTATSALGDSSQALLDAHKDDQFEVWNNPNSTDPTHSFLSKDHFALILNEPAGQIAKIIVQYTVERVVQCWSDSSINPHQAIEDILGCLHHPDFRNPQSQIQTQMFEHMRNWIDQTGRDKNEIINRLGSDNVRNGKNKRIGDTSTDTGHVHAAGLPDGGLQAVLAQHNVHVPGANLLNAGQDLAGGKMPWDQGFGQGGQHAWRGMDDAGAVPAQQSYGQQASYGGGQQQSSYGGGQQHSSYGGGQAHGGQQSHGQQQSYGQNQSYGGQQQHQQPSYGQQSYGQEQSFGGGHHGGHQGPPGGHQGGFNQPPPQQYGQHGQHGQPGGWNQRPPPQQFGGGPGYGQPPPPQQYGQQGGYGQPPPPPQGQWGQQGQQGQQGQYGQQHGHHGPSGAGRW